MAIPLAAIGVGLTGLSFAQGLLSPRKSYLDDPEVQKQLAELRRLSTDPGALAEVEKHFAPARARLIRDMTALGPPGASGAVSGALAELSGQEATAKTDLMRRAAQQLASTKIGLATTPQPQGPQIDFAGLGQALAYYAYLKKLGAQPGAPGAPGDFPAGFTKNFSLPPLPAFGG